MRLDELIQLKRIMEDLEGIPHRANVILMLFYANAREILVTCVS